MTSKNVKAMKKRVGQIAFHLDTAMEVLDIITPPFKEQHPEHAAVLEMVATTIVMAEDMMRKFVELTWGSCPKVLAIWKNK